jgi:signal transduction histidine kinase
MPAVRNNMAPPVRALAVTLLAVIGAFVGSTIWAQQQSHSIDDDALFISTDAAPAVTALSDARGELRDLQSKLIRTVGGRQGPAEDIDGSRARVEALVTIAVKLPNDETETALLGKLQAALRSFDEAGKRALEQSRAGLRNQARDTVDKEVRPAAEEASAVIRTLVDYDAEAVRKAAVHIRQARARADRFAYELDALCALLAIGAAILGMRLFRQVQRTEDEKRVLIERKAEELEQFAGRVAHDILSPLSAVSMAVAIVERRAPQEKEVLARASASLRRVRGIVDGLLEFARAGARPEAGARSEVQPLVKGLLEELSPFAERSAARLTAIDIPACAVGCSDGVLLSLLGNLLRNALKYLGDSKDRDVALRIKSRRGRVLFEVEDTGPGIPAHLTRRVFDPYVRGPNQTVPGIGLGLATVKRLVESHGGEIGLRATPKGGCLFWFELQESFPPEPLLDSVNAGGGASATSV